MRIVSARGMIIRCRLPEAIGNSRQFHEEWTAFLIQLETDGGLFGWGENTFLPHAVSAHVRHRLLPALMGKDPTAVLPLFRAMERTVGYDRRGAAMMAISAADMAIWDLAGRALGVPVATLLGGAVRDRVTAYASGPFMRRGPDPYARYEAEVSDYLKAGFRAFKIRAGIDPAADEAIIRRLRDLAGPDIAIALDINQGYLVRTALELDERLRGLGVLWIEEPIQPDDIAGYRFLAGKMHAPLAGGEALAGLKAFADFLSPRTFDIVQPDLSICGGFTVARAIAALGEANDVPVISHTFGTPINFFASLQLAAVLPEHRLTAGLGYPLLEYDVGENAMRQRLPITPVSADGTVAIPDRPGIGFEVDRAAFEPFIVEHWEEHL
ncbi:MAG: mandelate racemase/muconate lactonizing enzyme family protein [Rhizobiales bacterium]|nr:mandelate racemase/muconate lactonizing enzyme family protein [Hyphomicrobiales bacterium]